MTVLPVEWVLAIFYGPSAHRATYGRGPGGTKYTKDYIQLSRKPEFLSAIGSLFPTNGATTVPLTYKWPLGEAAGQLVLHSADRPHLAWGTQQRAPLAWKMSLTPSDATAETIPGDPTHLDFASAEKELSLLKARGAGQPYLIAIKLREESRTLHLRAYLAEASKAFAWADAKLLPQDIQNLLAATSQSSALEWAMIQSGGSIPSAKVAEVLVQLAQSESFESVIDQIDSDIGQALGRYLENPGYGLFFDPSKNHDAWLRSEPLSAELAESVEKILETVRVRFPSTSADDEVAESLEVSTEEVEAFRKKIENKSYEVTDTYATTKTRGSAQRAFAEAVKRNYESRCAITGIGTKDFLIAAHIVPWSHDQSIRLDPSNGVCLSLLMDRAFENGYLFIEDDLTVRVNWEKVGDDSALGGQLKAYDQTKLRAPKAQPPKPEYLQRRRSQFLSA